MNEVIQPAEPRSVLIETRAGLVRRVHLPCSDCESYEWLYWTDGSRRVECHGCGRFMGFDLKGTGNREQGTANTRDGPAAGA